MMRPGSSMGGVSVGDIGVATISKDEGWKRKRIVKKMGQGIFLRGGIVLLGLWSAGWAQQYTPPPPQLTVDPCAVRAGGAPVPADPKAKPVVCPAVAPSDTKGAPSTADQFPFPGEKPASGAKPSAADQFPFPGGDASKPAGGKAADQFPYPGETSKSQDAVPEGSTPRYVPDAPGTATGKPPAGEENSSSSSSSSSSDPTSGKANEPNKATDEDAPVQPRGRRPLPKVSALSPDERVTQDLDVAKFYGDHGNFQAAYLRAKDATKTLPDDADSHFVLAQAAQHLARKEEAVEEYALYLKLDPGGPKTSVARKALEQLR